MLSTTIIFAATDNYTLKNSLLNETELKRARDLISKQFLKIQKQIQKSKITVAFGGSSSAFKNTQSSPLKGSSFAEFASLGYQITPKISASIAAVQNKTFSRSKYVSFIGKGVDNIFSTSIDYKALKWLTLDFSMSANKGSNTNYNPDSINIKAISENIYLTPKFSLRMTIPLSPKVITMPDIGIVRTYMRNKAYTDNNGIEQPHKNLLLDQVSLNARIGYFFSMYAIPYAIFGYDRITRYKLPLRSKNTYRGGAGLMLMGGANFNWTVSKANQTTTINNFSLTFAAKF
jgi:hypothetical protein